MTTSPVESSSPAFLAISLVLTLGACGDDGDDGMEDASTGDFTTSDGDGGSTGSSTGTGSTGSESLTGVDTGLDTGTTTGGDLPGGLPWQACPEELDGEGHTCATVQVPLDWDQPEGQTIDLFVHRSAAPSQPARGQLWMLDGGPGGNGQRVSMFSRSVFGAPDDLDVYTMTHRGTGRSSLLACDALGPGGSGDYEDCGAQLFGQWGDGLAHFNSRQAARDLGHIVDRVSEEGDFDAVYGISYGTYLAMRYLKAFPEQPDVVVLDGILDLEAEVWFNKILAEAAGESIYTEMCTRSQNCTKALGEDPLKTYTDFMDGWRASGRSECAALQELTPNDFAQMHGMITEAAGEMAPLATVAAGLIRRVTRCNDSDVAQLENATRVLSELFAGDDEHVPQAVFSQALFANVLKQDFVGHLPEYPHDEVMAHQDKLYFSGAADPGYGMMQAVWPDIGGVPDDHTVQADTDVPMLLMNGGLDFLTVMPWAERAAAHFDGALQSFAELPIGGHGLVPMRPGESHESRACTQGLFQEVLANPLATPDMSCLDAWSALPMDGEDAMTKGLSMFVFGTDDVYNEGGRAPRSTPPQDRLLWAERLRERIKGTQKLRRAWHRASQRD